MTDDELRDLVSGAITRGIPLHKEIDIVNMTHAIWTCINENGKHIHTEHFIHYGQLSVIYVLNQKDQLISQIHVGPERINFLVPEDIVLDMKDDSNLRRNVGWCAMHTLHCFGVYIEKNHPELIPDKS